MHGVSLTQGTRGLLDEALERSGLVGTVARGREGYGQGRSDWNRHACLGPGEAHHEVAILFRTHGDKETTHPKRCVR